MRFKSTRLFFIFMLSIAGNLWAQNACKLPRGQYERNKVMVKLKKQPAAHKAARTAWLKKSLSLSLVREIVPLYAPADVQQTRLQAGAPVRFPDISLLYEVELAPGQEVEEAINLLRKNPLVEYAEPVPACQLLAPPPPVITSDPYLANQTQWGHYTAKVVDAWSVTQGDTNVVIGIIDTGIAMKHPDLRPQFKYNYAEKYGQPQRDDDNNGFVDDSVGYDIGEMDALPADEQGHGTAVAGIAGAATNNALGIAGVGYKCRIMPIKSYKLGRGGMEPVHWSRALIYAVNNGCKVVNISIGATTLYLKWEQELLTFMTQVKDVVIVASAGNSNAEGEFYPASYEHVMSVAHSDRFDAKGGNATYSHFIDLMAPGVDITSTSMQAAPLDYSSGGGGSSFASPFVAGAAGLVRAKYPHLTASQVIELLRVTSDDVYGVAANAALREKLGKGRVNVHRSVTEVNTAQSVRLTAAHYTDRFGSYAFYDDTVNLVCQFVNYLRPGSGALTATLSTTSPYATILSNRCTLRALGTLDSTNNSHAPFRIYLNPNMPPGTRIKFRVGFEDGSYRDYQYFTITTTPYYLNLKLNNISMSAAANGRLGYVDQGNTEGIGLSYNGLPMLKEAGLVVGVSSSRVSSAVLTTPGAKADDFKAVKHIKFSAKGLQHTVVESEFADNPLSPNRVGVEVKQKIKARINTPHHNYVIVEYDIRNVSSTYFDSVGVGLYADWNIADSINRAGWDRADNFGYVYKDGVMYGGIKALGTGYSYYAIDKINLNNNNINVTDSFSLAEKYRALSTGVYRTQAGQNGSGNDVAHVVGTRIDNLAPGASRKITFIIMGASTLGEMKQVVEDAETYLNPASPRANIPAAPQTLCSEQLRITPSGGTSFRFYLPPDLSTPFYVGSSLPVALSDTTKTYYISNVDSAVESELLKYQFRVHTATARFFMVDSLNIFDSSRVHLVDQSIFPVSWRWDFGDNTPPVYTPYPVHEYTRTGTFNITLTIIDNYGCTARLTKPIRVVRHSRSPKPVVAAEFTGCRDTPIRVRPSNGQRFAFYTSAPPATPVYTGSSLTVTDNKITRLFITNQDSTLESAPVVVKITRNQLAADFSYSPNADTIIFDQVQFTDLSTGNFKIVKWEWDFGDNSPHSSSRNPTYTYKAQGIYRVTLNVTDESGCTATTVKTFRVGKRGPLPQVPYELAVCKGERASITPVNGSRFNFYTSFPLHTPAYSGKTFTFRVNETTTVYVVNTDSIVESPVASVIVRANAPYVDFAMPSELRLYETTKVSLTDMSRNTKSWHWDFGDGVGVSTAQNPVYQYHKQGDYTVTLQVVDESGCRNEISKVLKVVNRGAKPKVNPQVICPGASVLIAPSGGSRFNFYTVFPSSTPVYTGLQWSTPGLADTKTFYVTNADSSAESEPVAVEIRVNKPSAEFSMSSNILDLTVKDTVFLEASNTGAVSWAWDMGNQVKSGRKTFAVYSQEGSYEIRLTVTDTMGCSHTTKRDLKVVKLPITGLEDEELEQFIKVYPNPTPGEAVLDISLPKASFVKVEIFNVIGKQMSVFEGEKVQNKSYPLDMRGYERGVYMLRLRIDDRVVVKKVVIY